MTENLWNKAFAQLKKYSNLKERFDYVFLPNVALCANDLDNELPADFNKELLDEDSCR